MRVRYPCRVLWNAAILLMPRLGLSPVLSTGSTCSVKTQSKVVAQLTLLVAITVLHRSCSVAAEPLVLLRVGRTVVCLPA